MFACEISKPGKKATWYKNDKEIKPSKKHEVKASGAKHTIRVNKCELEDGSKITCKVEDIQTEANLIVEGVSSNCNCINYFY